METPLESLDDFVETTLADHALDWCCCNGLNMRRTGGRKAGFVHVPVSLLPARLPRESFALVEPLAGSWNELVHVLTRTPEGVAWLHATIESVVGSDPFTRRLYDVAQRVAALRDARAAAADATLTLPPHESLALFIFRSDYMLHQPECSEGAAPALLQVELNTISCSFATLSHLTSNLHRSLVALAEEQGVGALLDAQYGCEAAASPEAAREALPMNGAPKGIASALIAAHRAYLACSAVAAEASAQLPVAVVFLVQGEETNVGDQRPIEYLLRGAAPSIEVLRLTLGELDAASAGCADAPIGSPLLLRPGTGAGAVRRAYEVSVVYFRAGYTPDDYGTNEADAAEWRARFTLEKSRCVACPDINTHLAGAKRVQQALATAVNSSDADDAAAQAPLLPPRALELCHALKAHFAAQFQLPPCNAAGRAAVEDALANPARWVIKPQREGGGNNTYNEEVRTLLETTSDTDLAAYVLMQRIMPRSAPTWLMRDGEVIKGDATQELGMYAVALAVPDELRASGVSDAGLGWQPECSGLGVHIGHLLRTKFLGVDEGGVASGYACLDSPYLV
mgnify:FL=1